MDCDELAVCDQCWRLAGGAAAIEAKIADDRVEPALVFDPAVDQLLAGADEYDLLHPIDRILVEAGIRWSVLRHIAVPARVDLASAVLERTPPEHTRAADSPTTWLDEVQARMEAQTGTEFRYARKRRRWSGICNVFAECADRLRRPLTWVTQEEIAAAMDCSPRTVRRCVAWLRAEGLLWEIVPGCQLPQQRVPDEETLDEREERHRRLLDAIASEDAAIARARSELDEIRAGSTPGDLLIQPGSYENPPDTPGGPLVRLAPVYQLQVPLSSAELAEVSRRAHLTSTNTPSTQIGHPPLVSLEKNSKSRTVQTVENRRAPRDPDPGPPPPQEDDQERKPSQQSAAVEAARWLLGSRLDPRLCDEVSLRWLAAQIRGSHLLDRHEWTWDDLADQIHGYPEYPHLPRYVRNCRAWIRTRLTSATPTLSPSKLRIIQRIERTSPALRQRRSAEAEQARRADIATRRAAIHACELCDELGWLHVPPDSPTARCSHDPATGGW